MRRSAFIIGIALILISVSLLAGCSPPVFIKATGPVVTKDYSFTDFTSVEVGNAFEIEIVPSNCHR